MWLNPSHLNHTISPAEVSGTSYSNEIIKIYHISSYQEECSDDTVHSTH